MFNRYCFEDIQEFEANLFQGPETAEKVFEREESYYSSREYRRELNKNGNSPDTKADSSNDDEGKKIWYEIYYDRNLKKTIRIFNED